MDTKIMQNPAAATVQKAENALKPTRYRWVVLLMVMVTYFIQYADRANLAVVLPALRKDFPITNLEAGLLMSFFFLGYVLTQIPSSFFYRRFGTRVLVPLSVLGFSSFTYLIGTATSAIAVKWFRLGLGLMEGPSPIGITTTINNWFPPKEKATAIGIGYVGATMVAPILVPPLCAWIMVHYGWRSVFFWFALPGIVMALVWYIWVRNRPEECAHCNQQEIDYIRDTETPGSKAAGPKARRSMGWFDTFLRIRKIKPLESIKSVYASKNIWCTACGYMLVIMANNGMLTWIPSYLVAEKHYSFIKMGFMAALPWIGGFIGSTFGGWLSDRYLEKRRKPTMLVTSLATAVLMGVLINIPEDLVVVGATLFAIGFFLHLGYPGFTAYPMAIANKETYPSAIALVNSVGNLGGFFSPIIAGALLDYFKVYSAAFAFFGLASLLAFVCIMAMDEPEV